MSEVIVIGVGQCGCSVADALLELIHEQEESSSFFEDFVRPRALLVDSEPKAISKCIQKRRAWSYDPRNTLIVGQSGAGNNWAAGYSMADDVSEQVLSALERESERCDNLDGLVIVSSAAGGTGSGLGSRITEEIRERFPRTSIMNAVVAPFMGEVAVQHYNACLSLSHLLEVSDGICMIENQVMNRVCTNVLQIPQPSFTEINDVIAQHLSTAVLPSQRRCFSDSVRRLCGHPGFKFFTSTAAPIAPKRCSEFFSDSWSALTKQIYHQHSGGRSVECTNKSVACVLKFRGHEAAGALKETEEVSLFKNKSLYPTWNDDPFIACSRDLSVNSHGPSRSVSLLSNSQSSARPLERMSSMGYNMYLSRAYVHQYAANGVFEDDFENAFAGLERAVFDYESL
jgi:tubulin delta